MLEISELMSSTPHVYGDWIAMSLQTPDVASVWRPQSGGTSAEGQRNVGITTIPCRTLPKPESASVCESTHFLLV